MLSVVIPSYNEEASVAAAADMILSGLSDADIPCELIFVDDGSRDKTWDEITAAAGRHSNVRGVRFSRNFGKEAAITAGLTAAKGKCCAVMDCDLQHPPEKLIDMYRLWEQGYEIIEGRKTDRGKEGALHSFSAKLFYSAISSATGFDMANASDFKLLDRKAVDVIIHMPEKNAFFRALTAWVGFKTAVVPFEVRQRSAGKSKWSVLSLTRYALNNIASFSAAPMQIVTVLGTVMLAVAVVFGAIALVQKCTGRALGGFTTVILLQLFSGSIIMISLGIIGYYIAKIYEEVKNRPRYIIGETCGGEEDQ